MQKSEDWKKMTHPCSQQSQLIHSAEPVLRSRPSYGVSRCHSLLFPRHTHTRWPGHPEIQQVSADQNCRLPPCYTVQGLRGGPQPPYVLLYYYERSYLLYQLLTLITLSFQFQFLIIALCLLKGLVSQFWEEPAYYAWKCSHFILILSRTFYMSDSV